MKTIRKGSITIWLSLVLCVLLALIFACLQSARISAARGYISVCVEESLFSEFARYDRILYEQYGLLAVDAGFGTAGTDLTAVAGEIEDAAKTLISTQQDLFRIGLKETDITGYELATDSNAAPLKTQIKEIMTAKLGIDGVSRIIGMVNANAPVIEQQEREGTVDPESIRDAYAQQKEQAEARENEAAMQAEARENEAAVQTEAVQSDGGDIDNTEEHTDAGPVEVPEDFENPLDNIESLIRMGIYNTILPDPLGVSGTAVDKSTLARSRKFEEGMGVLPEEADGAAEHLMIAAYINDFFPDFLSCAGSDNKGLKYQAEFAIAGKDSDAANLKSVLNRILMIRMGLNYIYLNSMDPAKKAEAETCGLIIASLLLSPEAAEPISQIVLLAWAFGESMMDLKTMLAGGKEPLIKDESTWQLTLTQLASFSSETPTTGRTGLSYDDYLTILLAIQSESELTRSLLDLLEYNRRIIGDDPAFQIDACITAIETETLLTIDGNDYSITRGYGYESR